MTPEMHERRRLLRRQANPVVVLVEDNPEGAHVLATALMGQTAAHLAAHGIDATDDKRENARLHLHAHRLSVEDIPEPKAAE